MTPPVVLTIAGSDSGAGAGIQADLKVCAALGAYGTSVVTATTAQNTLGVFGAYPVLPDVVTAQLDAVLADFSLRAVKTGMLGTPEIASVVAARARAGLLPNLVVDPVLVSTSGHRLGVVGAAERLLPYALVTTPNSAEAAAIVGRPVTTPTEMADAAREIASGGPRYVVVTGGDRTAGTEAVDVLWTGTESQMLSGPRVDTPHTHGTGCSFSTAIAVRLGLGDPVPDAVRFAKVYVAAALAGARHWRLGGGRGPLDHLGWNRTTADND
ncbi:bifunctional hydroxymethylpyrimidine kinase/phosphomethylpyrimidine kinase [Micromonospora polyrhachis]|uniref:Hydroxymethylpyrimidine kinase/phosphomethylpyrimidine kinase n=1 Tax=Micromonospora polyrhachis TaxID=1282883 RepID=A0A7W7SNU2_9ACTN|nr:bifunctional hydroxymethylpyrimidine kinase/phosphomethylpyrimidine kinase [Micromonospora polyrhachis]MBB4958209.1 hydroxymethylpyrimidine kinase/phosphomethylpyrimidine kinase [Micromonospora polyrhachis]